MVACRLAKEADELVLCFGKRQHGELPHGKKSHRDTGGHRLVLQQKTVINRLLHLVTRE